MQPLRDVVAQAVVDVQIQVVAPGPVLRLVRDASQLRRPDVLNADQTLQGPPAVDAGRFRPGRVVEDQGELLDSHVGASWIT